MCGIVAIFAYGSDARPIDRDELVAIRDYMTPRGPDGAGEWWSRDKRVALGHRRLSIIDLSPAGAQPMVSGDGSIAVTFNGEIYNHGELRSELEQKGYTFRSSSDTEVLLRLYEDCGEALLERLRGMYAFAIWDERKQGLFLARDPFGIKPLYMADDGKTLRLASQVKALLAGKRIETAPEPAGHVGFFLWGHVPEPYTLYRNIRALAAGTALWVTRNGAGRPRTFCSVPDIFSQADASVKTGSFPAAKRQRDRKAVVCDHLRGALDDSIRHHLIADVPVGVFLSAGLDSSTIAALSAEQGGKLKTVTLGFEEYRGTIHDEVPLAEATARHFGAEHRTVWVTRAEFQQSLAKVLDAMDSPTTDGVNTYFVSLAAKRASLKVALSGLGGDELFGGYPSFAQVPVLAGALSPFRRLRPVGEAFRSVTSPVLKRFTSPKYAGLLEYGGTFPGAYLLRRGLFMPWEIPEIIDADMAREGWRELQPIARIGDTIHGIGSAHAKISCLEISWYMRNQLLRDSDWAGMAHSLEIRVPLVDIEVLRRIVPYLVTAPRLTKLDMASTPLSPLPKAVLARKKSGFAIPVADWSAEEKSSLGLRGLRDWAIQVYIHQGGLG